MFIWKLCDENWRSYDRSFLDGHTGECQIHFEMKKLQVGQKFENEKTKVALDW